MKKYFIPTFIMVVFWAGCKKDNPNAAAGDISATSAVQLLSSKLWRQYKSSQTYPPNYLYFQLEFLKNTQEYGPYGGTVIFGQQDTVGSTSFGENSSVDAFKVYVQNGSAFLDIGDVVSSESLTGYTTYYKILNLSSSGFTLVSAGQPTPSAPSFPADTFEYKPAN